MHKSPNLAHSIPHQWVIKRCKNPNKICCVVCSSLLGFLSSYEKCKSCNCGFTSKHFKELLTQMVISARQENWAPNIYIDEEIAVEAGSSRIISGHKWDRRSWNMFTIRGHTGISWKEETIPFSEIKVKSLIGHGRFGEVYEVDHFGTVAIKLINMNHVEEEKRLEAFKQDTACFQNARHENLVFFCGYTMDQDRLGIVTELIKGQPLHTFLHNNNDVSKKLEFNTILDFAKQICQVYSSFLK